RRIFADEILRCAQDDEASAIQASPLIERIDSVRLEHAGAAPVACQLDNVADADIVQTAVVTAHHHRDEGAGDVVVNHQRSAAEVDTLDYTAQDARGVRRTVIGAVVVVVVAEGVVVTAEADIEADVEAREKPEARLGDEEWKGDAAEPDAVAAAESLVSRDRDVGAVR